MVEKCGYLPLAVCLLGGVMRKKISMGEWELANENMHEFIYRGEGLDEMDNKLDGVLNLSYQNLPYYLKPCFLCLSMFNEDDFIDADILYGMWISQGMISSEHIRANDGESLMDIAELYLNELVSRSLVRVNVNDILPRRKYLSCQVHDIVRELCLKLGKKEDFGVQILGYQVGKLSSLIRKALLCTKTRHLAIQVEKDLEVKDEGITINGGEDTGRYLRTLQIYNQLNLESGLIEFPPQSIVDFNKFRLLRELTVLRFKFVGGKLPRGITHLCHLRCLRLQHCKLEKLPSSIRNFVYLDTLDLLGSTNVRVPNVLKKFVQLRELIFPDYDKEAVGSYRLRLEEDAFDQLESLMGFNSSVHELKSFTISNRLRNFSARVDNNESLIAVVNAIAAKGKRLHICVVEINDGCQLTSHEELTEKLFTCPYLHILRVGIRLGKLPMSSGLLSSVLIEVTLLGSEIEDDPMEVLGKLPCLVELNLLTRSFVGEEMSCTAFGFPRLGCLVLDDLPKLRDWKVEQGSMPLLCELAILHCPCLKMVPDGFRYISTLKKLTISEMSELRKRVSPSGEDFHKISHVPSINIHH